MQTETIAIDRLIPDPANARKHSTKNIEAIKSSLARFGQQKPIVIDADGVVRAGNGTLEAAKQLEWTELEVVRSELVGPEMTAFAIADNRTSELAEWDYDVLGQVLGALEQATEGIAGELGFAERELEALLTQVDPLVDQPDVAELDPDEVNQPPQVDEYSLRINGIPQEKKQEVEDAVRLAVDSVELEGELEILVF